MVKDLMSIFTTNKSSKNFGMLSNLKRSINENSLRDVNRLNVMLTFFVLVCALIFLVLAENSKVTIVMSIKSGLYMFTISSLHKYMLRYSANKFDDNLFMFRLYRYVIGYVMGISLYLFSWYIAAPLAGLKPLDSLEDLMKYGLVGFMINTVILVLHDFVIVRRVKIQSDIEVARLQTRNAEAENLLLKQQIQPHFLFNALSTLKVLYGTDTGKGDQYLLQLSDFLRVAVSNNRKVLDTLDDELTVCKNYLNMQKIRFAESLDWTIQIEDPEKLQGYVPTFSIQSLAENAIKHNSFTTRQPLKITIRQHGEYIEVFNSIKAKSYGDISTKSGLGNLAERYYLLTGEEITVKNDGKVFCVGFKIITDESSNN
ncbi:hypothetical protein GCM10009120_51440 [Sphingobacterium siyangense subsp. cladoniae]